jgi:small subunit ribosomal protein S1
VKDLQAWVGQKIQVQVIEMDAGKGNVVVSRRKILDKAAAQKRDETLKNLQVGSVHKGTVTSLTGFGAFVDIGGVEGLLRITDVSWGWVGKLSDALKVGQEIDVKVLKFDPATGKIGLGASNCFPSRGIPSTPNAPSGPFKRARSPASRTSGPLWKSSPASRV